MKPTNCTTHDQRPRRRLREAQAHQHLAGLEPVIGLDRLLRHVGEHRIGAAEGDDRHLAVEGGDRGEDVRAVRASRAARRAVRARSRRRSRRPCRKRASDGRTCAGISRAKASSISAGASHAAFAAPCPPPALNQSGSSALPTKPISAAAKMMSGNGSAKKKMPTKASAAIATSARLLSARLPTRTTASSTTASTAAFRPKNSDCTMPIWPNSA